MSQGLSRLPAALSTSQELSTVIHQEKPIGRKYSTSIPDVARHEAMSAKKAFESSLRDLSHQLQAIQSDVLWESVENIARNGLERAVASKQEAIDHLKIQLEEASESLKKSGKALGTNEFARLSHQFSEIQAQLHSLESSLEVYRLFSQPDVKNAAEKGAQAQILCQQLSRLARHEAKFSDYEGTKSALFAHIETITSALQTEKNPAAKKILEEAAELLQGILEATIDRIDGQNPIFAPWHSEQKRAFYSAKAQLLADLRSQQLTIKTARQTDMQEPKDPAIVRLTIAGRISHHQEYSELVESLTILDRKTSDLLDKVASGMASASEQSELQELQSRLHTTKTRYDALQLTIGKRASETQFAERAICSASIVLLEKRLTSLTLLLGTLNTFPTQSAAITSLIGSALNASGKNRAKQFYHACEMLEKLEVMFEESQPQIEDPLARKVLESKLKQLRTQLESASATIFSSESRIEKEEAQYALQMASNISLKQSQKDRAIPFLIKAMTQLTMFDLPTEKASSIRTVVDLCLLNLTEEEKSQLPERLLSSYQTTANPDWTAQIAQAKSLINAFKKALSQDATGLDEVAEMERCEQKLKEMAKALPKELYGVLQQSIAELKKESPIKLTSKERNIVEHLPSSPSKEEQQVVEVALAKLLLKALHDIDPASRNQARHQAKELLNALGFKVDYQSVIDSILKQDVMKEFQKTISAPEWNFTQTYHNTAALPKIEQAQAYVDHVFTNLPSWAQLSITVDSLPITLEESERKELSDYIRARQDFALLTLNTPLLPKKKERSWEETMRLTVAYHHLSSSQFLEKFKDLKPRLAEMKWSLDQFASKIADDKQKAARGTLPKANSADSWNYENQILGKKRIGKTATPTNRSDRINNILGPILYQACFVKPPTNPDLVAALPQIFARLEQDNAGILVESPELFPLYRIYLENLTRPIDPNLVPVLNKILSPLVREDPNIFLHSPKLLDLLEEYLPMEAPVALANAAVQKSGERPIEAAAVRKAISTVRNFLAKPFEYDPDSPEWKQKADIALKAARLIGKELTPLGIGGKEIFDETERLLQAAIERYGQTVLLHDGEIVTAQQTLRDLSLKLSPEYLKTHGYQNFAADYQKYQQTLRFLQSLLAARMPVDQSLVSRREESPHAHLVETMRGRLESQLKGTSENTVEEGKRAFMETAFIQEKLEKGRTVIKEQIAKMKNLPPSEQAAFIFSDTFRTELRKILGDDLPPDIQEELWDRLFTEFAKAEKIAVEGLAKKLQESPKFDPILFQEYTEHAINLLIISNLRFSGKNYQSLSDSEKSDLYPSYANPLNRFEGMSALKKKASPNQLLAIEAFKQKADPLQTNLDNLPLRCKKKPLEVLLKDMRADFQGFLANAEGRGKGLMDLVGENPKAPDYPKSLGSRIGTPPTVSSPVPKQKLQEAQAKLKQAATILQTSGDHIKAALSDKTRRELATATSFERPILFASDTSLTMETMHRLMCDGSIEDALKLVKEASELVKEDPALASTFSSLYAQIATWFKGPLEDVLRSCPEEAMRQDLFRLLTSLKAASV